MVIGDVVWLKSGGARMTVVSVDKDAVMVTWMNGSFMSTATYPPDCFATADPEPALNDARQKAVDAIVAADAAATTTTTTTTP